MRFAPPSHSHVPLSMKGLGASRLFSKTHINPHKYGLASFSHTPCQDHLWDAGYDDGRDNRRLDAARRRESVCGCKSVKKDGALGKQNHVINTGSVTMTNTNRISLSPRIVEIGLLQKQIKS